jgi:hypothetical protein
MGALGIGYKSRIIRLLLTAGMMLVATPLIAQQNYVVFGKVSVTQGTVGGVDARLQRDGQEISISVNEKGEFKSTLAWNQNFLFVFSKKGYIAKSIKFSTEIPDNVTMGAIEPYMLLVELSPVMVNVDTAFFENPVGFIKFDSVINDFDFDRDYSLKVRYSTPVQKKKEANPNSAQKKRSAEPVAFNNTTKLPGANQPSGLVNGTAVPVVTRIQDGQVTQNPVGFPPLLTDYPAGVTREEFVVPGRRITRVVLKENNRLMVYFMVRHDWGGTFFFINEIPGYFRAISRESFIRIAGKYD